MKNLRIGQATIGDGKPVFIMAEAGVNHNGRLDLALKLIDKAADGGADAIKFQTFKAEQVVTRTGKIAAYQKRNTGIDEGQLAMLQKLTLDESFYRPLIAHAKKRGIIFLSTPHGGFESVDFLQTLNIPAFKFSSADLTNLPVLAYAARLKKPMILSTGMATMKEVSEAVRIVRKAGNKNIVVLQCTTDYPTKPEDVHANVIHAFREHFDAVIGFSDHSITSQASVIAVALGARVLEKHLTLDKSMEGPDHKASATPEEFEAFVRDIRRAEKMMGSYVKKPSNIEKQYIPLVRKSVVAKTNIRKGDVFTKENLTMKRPGTGLAPRFFSRLVGKKSKRNISADTPLSNKDL